MWSCNGEALPTLLSPGAASCRWPPTPGGVPFHRGSPTGETPDQDGQPVARCSARRQNRAISP